MTASLTAADLQPSLAGRYTIERELGHGGMAMVFLARDLKHDRDVAIKVLDPHLASSIANERFLREIGISARLNHPHVLPLLDSGIAGAAELPFYVMPLVAGESLRDRLRRDGRLSLEESLRLAAEVTDALAYAHEHHVVHRDVKPDNVMLSGGHAVVMDFGIAKAVGEAREDATLTGEGISLGTPAYMAPEQAAGEHTVDHRADVYAVGALLFEMLSGTPPFAGSWQHIVMEKMAKDAPLLASRWPDAPAPVVKLVARCLARDPDLRPATAEALLRELHTLAAPPAPRAVTRSARRRWPRRARGDRHRDRALPARAPDRLGPRHGDPDHRTTVRRRSTRLGVRARKRGGGARTWRLRPGDALAAHLAEATLPQRAGWRRGHARRVERPDALALRRHDSNG